MCGYNATEHVNKSRFAREIAVIAALVLFIACAAEQPQPPKSPQPKRILYALPERIPERYAFRPLAKEINAIAWLSGQVQRDGRFALSQREKIVLGARQRAAYEHHLLFPVASVAGGNALLRHEAAWRQSVTSIRQIVQELPFTNAIHLDFEYLDPALAGQFVRYVKTLRTSLDSTIGLYVTVFPPHGMPQSWSAFFDLPALAQAADGLVVMLYDLHRAQTLSGCVSSVAWPAENAAVLSQLPPQKIWLAAPLYGYRFSGKTATVLSRRAFDKIFAAVEESDGCLRKVTSGSEAYYPAPELYAAYERIINEHNFAGIAYWRAGLEL